MSSKDREAYNAYMKAYMLKRYHTQRAEALTLLGGVCVQCGATTQLQLDHVDPKKKSFTLSNLWSRPRKSFLKELKKCQILCKS